MRLPWVGPAQGIGRELRGGSFDDQSSAVRSADRSAYEPWVRGYNIGFRVARTYP